MTDQKYAITFEYLHEAFEYRDGKLFWKERPLHHFASAWTQKIFNSRQAKKEAGTLCNGYRRIHFKDSTATAHRIIFMMHHGFWASEIDHIDGNPINNHVENLRAVTHAQNLKNANFYSSNKSGVKGVFFHKTQKKKFIAYIKDGEKQKHLGSFSNLVEAASARKMAEKQYYGGFANGR